MGSYKESFRLLCILILIGGSILFLESRKVSVPDRNSTNSDIKTLTGSGKAKQYVSAKEISTPDGFINTDAISIADLIGKNVILIDFWTYSCINCQRTLPYLNAWYEKYADQGLEIIGIHTPEFDFEKEYANVERAVQKFGIKYPIVLDNDYSTWQAYKNQYWPRKYLIDIDGFVVYDHIGEGGYDETEAKIVALLNERNRALGVTNDIRTDTTAPRDVSSVDFSKVGSPEMYFGSTRIQYLSNIPAQACLSDVCTYNTPHVVAFNNYALDGVWSIEPERALLKSTHGSITLRFSASKVNLVAGSTRPVKAKVYLDGQLIQNNSEGAHVTDGVVIFNTYDLYNLVDLRGNYGEHTLRIDILDTGLQAFAFTFG